MTSQENPDLRDRYDEIPEDHFRVGRHRKSMREPAAGYRRLVIAGVAALLIGLFSASVLPFLGFIPKQPRTPAVAASSPSKPASAKPTSSPSASVDPALRRRTVDIVNATGEETRARDAAAQISAAGWVVGELAPASGQAPARTTVYYSEPALEASAKQLAEDLGGAEVALDATGGKGRLRVVLSAGYAAG